MTERFQPASGVTLAYDLTGEGPGLVCLPGLGAGRESFALVEKACRDRRLVLRADPRGIGESTCEASAARFEWEDLARDVELLIEAVAAEHPEFLPCDVVGISFGGALAQLLAYRHPEWVRHLFLVSTSHRKSAYGLRINLLMQTLVEAVPPDTFGEVMTTFAFSQEFLDTHPGLRSLKQDGISTEPGTGEGFEGRYRPAFIQMVEMSTGHPGRFSEPFPLPPERVTAIVGANDLMLSPAGRQSILELAGERIVLPEAGHVIGELPQLINARL